MLEKSIVGDGDESSGCDACSSSTHVRIGESQNSITDWDKFVGASGSFVPGTPENKTKR